jgi:hypothetical protein
VQLHAKVTAAEAGERVLPAYLIGGTKQLGGEALIKARARLDVLAAAWPTPKEKEVAHAVGTHVLVEMEVERLEYDMSKLVGQLLYLTHTAYRVKGNRPLEKRRDKHVTALRTRCVRVCAPQEPIADPLRRVACTHATHSRL